MYKIKILDILDIIKLNLKVNNSKNRDIDTTPRYVVNRNKSNRNDNKRRKNNRNQSNNNSIRWR